jgi:uncharacterized protein (DUF433 family)
VGLIVRIPGVLNGKACVAGTRISVEYLLELLEDGHTIDEIVAEHDQLTRDGVEAAIAYAREALQRAEAQPAAK